MKTISCLSPAKINWFLHITGRRDNGYHELQTLFQFIDLADTLHFELTNDANISLNGDLLDISAQNNLIYKAAQALMPYNKQNFGIKMRVEKRIPAGAGLGGGSSNCATTLLILNKLWQINLSIDQLAEIGVKLGADVPVFVRGTTAFAQGIGEFLYPTTVPEQSLLLAIAKNCHVSTAELFADKNLPRNTAKIDFSHYSFEKTGNDFESIAKARFAAVAKTLDWLIEYAPSRMTGSGAACFALFDTPEQAQKVAKLAPNDINAYVVSTLNTSPVHALIAEQF
ncbi:4-(cytidine 5'-diphospho)-2-C-methyl-D-erythritol kinase [Catenovulum sp. 2E275]|uniref:4-(cytidine 5'-diphospho)-2-C-methyl-D-erythritol kinase n=1 Tax=Catenovulum sp. 2E275 TaxID=2980497 RepID=UPI0021CF35B9|nr:4-(cytidine 5'-diphospho)-2-C-methyl-D-erythritol kinase [Catenovulum sp. 2E275]MCU4675349.1 4-(cytidine 5'-diphospho)-2-C-methyl-D-erythritol kinase [Catenovulum sp. 2E275]